MDFSCRQVADHVPKDLAIFKHTLVFTILVEDFLLDSIGNEGDFLAKPGSTELFLDSIRSLFSFF